jgi:hypothetical protein
MWAYSKNHLLDDRLDKIIVNTSRSFPNLSLMTGFVTRFLVFVIKCFVFQLDFQLKATFAVVPTDNICGRSLSLKIFFDMNSIILKLYLRQVEHIRGH